jgi:sulfatase maturation enzyme AslB (radical SAM superfamily)
MFPFVLPGKEEFLSTCSRVTLTLLLTERCNYRCQHCLYACGPSKSDLYMPDSVLEHAARAVQECSALEDGLVLNFIGGEISIDSTELARVVTWVTGLDAFFRVSMVTNGWFLQSPKTLAKIAEALRPSGRSTRTACASAFPIRHGMISSDRAPAGNAEK